MAELAELKKSRSTAKRAVTCASRKLKAALQLGSDAVVVSNHAHQLEALYDDFHRVHLEYCEQTGEDDDDDYYEKVYNEYMVIMGEYTAASSANTNIETQRNAAPLRKAFTRSHSRLSTLLDRMEETLSDRSDTIDVSAVHADKDEVDVLLNSVMENLVKLCHVVESDTEDAQMDAIVVRVDDVKRQANLVIRQYQHSALSLSPSSLMSGPVKPANLGSGLTHDDMSSPTHAAPNNPEVSISLVAFSDQANEPLTSQADGKSLHRYQSSTGIPMSTAQVQQSATVTTATLSSAGGCVPISMGNQLPPSFPRSSGSESNALTSVAQSIGSAMPTMFPGMISQASLSSVVGSTPMPNHVYGAALGYGPTHGVTSGFGNSPGNGISHGFDNNNLTPSHASSYASTIHTKKPSLPTFSGQRADWPEFKCVWRSLAEAQFTNRMQLAMELKKACSKGKAADAVKHMYVTSDTAYDDIWKRLSEEYDDPGLSVQSAINTLMTLRSVDEYDYRGIVKLIDIVEGVHNQLKELAQLEAVHMTDVDRISALLPRAIHMDWNRKYRDMSDADKMRPFPRFMAFLKSERSAVARLAESIVATHKRSRHEEGRREKHSVGSHFTKDSQPKAGCVLHGDKGHVTADCRNFKKLTLKQRFDVVRKEHRCFKCFEGHPKAKCTVAPCKCGKDHHLLLCISQNNSHKIGSDTNQAEAKGDNHGELSDLQTIPTETHVVSVGSMALYPIQRAHISGISKPITVFADGGSNASYITERCASKLNLRKLKKVTLDVTTVGGEQKIYPSVIYEVPLRIQTGKTKKLMAYGLKDITGPLSQLDRGVIQKLFPEYDSEFLLRPSTVVDLMIGTDYYGLHPKQEVARAGEHLSIMRGELGVCLVGTHPNLKEETVVNRNVPKQLNGLFSQAETLLTSLRGSHQGFTNPHSFVMGEELGTESVPRCGGCKCGKCPQPGHSLSFKEEQELHMIRSNLQYNPDDKHWVTSYPWLVDPSTLPDNYTAALATLRSIEKSLAKDPLWAASYCEQVQDMVQRKAARKLSPEEMNHWQGPVFYLCHLAVKNPKSNSTPVRIVFNSSQSFRGVSLNNCLAKGPDSYMNSGLGILLRWREEAVALVGDIRKMFHSVFLQPLEQHCHRFLWRELDSNRNPDIYVMGRVNMGDRPAAAIATEALYMTADLGNEHAPQAAKFIRRSSYMDDLIDSRESKQDAIQLAEDSESILRDGGVQVKCWQMTGESGPMNTSIQHLKGGPSHTGVLGIYWNPTKDTMTYQISLNFSPKWRGERIEPDIQKEQVPESIPQKLTRRLVLQQVMSIYDPMGLVSPFTIMAKIHLRETWALKLDWDEELPSPLHKRWVDFFRLLFGLEELSFPRCLRPVDAVGLPWLILLSDGSDLAYGCAAYVRWRCEDGSFQILMAKSRIAPINKVSTPRMELNGAVLSKRCRVVITKEMRYTFERVLHLVDSETVLSMLHKTSYRFKIYEGVRLGEIQSATAGDMHEWAWLPGEHNTADWLTRGRPPSEIDYDSIWFSGPPMLCLPFDQWNIKFGKVTDDILPGEKKITQSHTAEVVQTSSLIDYDNVNTLTKALRVVARIIGIARRKSFRGGAILHIDPGSIQEAEILLIKPVQAFVNMESPDYRRLNPVRKDNGIWVVGASRLANYNPMAAIHSSLPVFLPRHHPFTRLAMNEAHRRGHRGRDATLAAFRNKYWTPSGPALAKSVKNNCQLCKLRDVQLMKQEMGSLPTDRLKPSPPFNHVMVDLFGPYSVRGEVQKRISGKAWGVIFTDMCSRAVHIEAIFGYDTSSFLLALSRFASLRGWPQRIYSDPGSQLLGASKEINEAAACLGTHHGMQWIVGPADSPWHQGAVEALVKSTKRSLDFAVHNQRLSTLEFLTVCTEAANLINERPIGLLPGLDSDINVLSANCLLLGRAIAANPSGWQPGSSSLKTRYHLVAAVGNQFWKHWMELFAPTLVYRPKWFSKKRNLQVGDIVLVADSNALRGEYRLARVSEVYPGKDGQVRSALVSYKNFKTGEKVSVYQGAPFTSVKRGIQRLVLLVRAEADDAEPNGS